MHVKAHEQILLARIYENIVKPGFQFQTNIAIFPNIQPLQVIQLLSLN